METNVRYAVTGLFVIAMVSIITVSIIWLSAGLSSGQFVYYRVYMQESISGLSVDSPVEFNGVNVGSVSEININRTNPRVVSLVIKINNTTPVTLATRAKLDVRGVTGNALIMLEDKGEDLRPLVAEKGQPYPVIQTAPSFFMRLDTALKRLNNSFERISLSIQSLLDEGNLRAIHDSLNNMSMAAKNLATMSQNLNVQTLPSANQALDNLSGMARNLSDTTMEVKQNPAVLLRGQTQPLGPGEK
jgi:phospholipid/cholesterol/gamma-HCH transport system substrate-binding protein